MTASLTTSGERLQGGIFLLLVVLAAGGLALAPQLVFQVAPVEPQMGFVQKIFYYHVPCAWLMLLSALVAGVAGGAYLARRRPAADRLCAACTELAALFGLLVMVTGPLWARKAWGHYWVWDPRLTTLLVLWLSLIGAMLVRRFASSQTGSRLAAGVALFAAANVPLVYASVLLFRTNHPDTTVVITLTPSMRGALWVSVAAFTLLFAALLWVRLQVARLDAELDDLVLAANAPLSRALITQPPPGSQETDVGQRRS